MVPSTTARRGRKVLPEARVSFPSIAIPIPHKIQETRVRRFLLPSAALVGGLQLALLNPVIALLLTALYGASAAETGLILAIMNASGFVAAIVIPAWADRRREYLMPMFLCGALTLATAVLLAVTTSLAVAGIVLVVLAGPAGTWSGLLFAHQRASGGTSEEVIRIRAVFSVAWVAGPPLATGVMTGFGDRMVLVLIAAVAAASLIINLALSASIDRRTHPIPAPTTPRRPMGSADTPHRRRRERLCAWVAWNSSRS